MGSLSKVYADYVNLKRISSMFLNPFLRALSWRWRRIVFPLGLMF